MQKLFDLFDERLRLTDKQEEDAKVKYNGVCKTIHKVFYPDKEYDGSTKYLFGSYRKKTNIRPIVDTQDVDVLIKLPIEEYRRYDAYEGNGQSQLLQDLKNILKETYTTTEVIKAWGKVILINFADGSHNVELLPAWENSDGIFTIPNSEDGGYWESFDVRSGIKKFQDSNSDTKGLTAILSRFLKCWKREVYTLTLKSYQIEDFVIDYLSSNFIEGENISLTIKKLFQFIEQEIDLSNKSHLETAVLRSKKALEFEEEKKYESAVVEWKKIFGDSFPAISNLSKSYAETSFAPGEQFIEKMYPVRIDPKIRFNIDCKITQNGFRPDLLSEFLSKRFRLQKKKKIEFFVKDNNLEEPYSIKWKVRNYGVEAEDSHDLRGEITNDVGGENKIENTKYSGEHYVECYLIKDNICVARSHISVPINNIS